jgi:hypothetical protein
MFILAPICLALHGNAVGEVDIAGIHRGAHKVHTCLIRIDAFTVNVRVGASIIMIGVCTNSGRLHDISE